MNSFTYIFSRILATGTEQLFSWTTPSCWTPLVVKISKIHVKKFIVNKASDLHPTALIKIELCHRYFFKDFSHRCKTVILLNISEWLLTKILKNKRTHRHISKMTVKDFVLVKLQARIPAALLKKKYSNYNFSLSP